ncbi:MAG: class I SAM-dependent methyltransferase [Myxococcales bacterium]|nr:class I SAM-dependent methyltransferase [Myxococcales bacterium]
MPKEEVGFEDFERYFPYAPAALCVKECARLTELRRFDCPGPILDVGCGDGLFATVAFGNTEIWGIDIDAKEGAWALSSRAYAQVILGDITRAKLPEGFFSTCVANCSLEHIPDLDAALRTIRGSLKPGGRAYMFVPNRDWASWFLSVRLLKALGLESAGQALQDAVDHTFKHHHLYDEAGWRACMEKAGLRVERAEPVLSTATTVAFELLLVPSLLGFVNKKMTTRWTNFPRLRKLAARPAFGAVRAALAAGSDPAPTAEFLMVCSRPE